MLLKTINMRKFSFTVKSLILMMISINIISLLTPAHAQVFLQSEDVLSDGFILVEGSPDVHVNGATQFGINEVSSEGDSFVGFHPSGQGLPGNDSSVVFETFSIPVNLQSGTSYRFTYDIAVARLDGLAGNLFWDPQNLGNHPGFVEIYGGNGAGIKTQLLHTSTAAPAESGPPFGVAIWNPQSFDFTSAGSFTHLTFVAFGQGGAFTTPYIILDNLQSVPLIDLVTNKTLASGNSTPTAGDTVTFAINVANNGPSNATGVNLTDLLPAGLNATVNNGNIAVTGTSTGGSYNAGTGLWNIGTLNVGDTATLTIEGIVQAGLGGQIISNVTTAASGNELNTSTAGNDLSEDITIASQVDMIITKTNTPGQNAEIDQNNDFVTSGSTVTYVITVTNSGPDTVIGAIVTDTIVSGLTCPAGNLVTITGSGVPAASFTVGDLTSGGGIVLDTLNNNESAILSYDCIVN